MKFICLALFLAVSFVIGKKLVEGENQGLLQFDSPEVQKMHTKCGTPVSEHRGLQNDFSTHTSTADTSTEPFLPTSRRTLRYREEDTQNMHKKFADLDLPFSLPFSLAPNLGLSDVAGLELEHFPPLPPILSGLSIPFANAVDAHDHGGPLFSFPMSMGAGPLEANGAKGGIGINPIDPDCDCNLPPALNATCCHIPKPVCNPGKIDCKIPWYVPFPPVCGCDGKTYDNFCDALFGNCVKCWTAGRCPK